MRNKFFASLSQLNKYFFPFLVIFTYFFTFLETYSYIGVFRKVIFVDSRFFVILVIVSASLLNYKKLTFASSLALKVNTYLFILLTLSYLWLQFSESGHFRNFIFSEYHIQLNNFFYLVVLSGGLCLVHRTILQKYFKKLSLFIQIFSILLMAVFMENFVLTINTAVYTNFYILRHYDASHDFKMNERWGIYYDYMMFVKENTPENSSIMVPPQRLPWYSTGNVGLSRYFLYPRNLDNGQLNELADIKKYDYILISWGEWNNEPKESYGWPKIAVPAEEIIYFDAATHEISRILGDYIPKESVKNGVWGIIKIKK